ncbi:MAG TPA: dihydrodipicolinate reductase [Candidatus Binatia bacterium]|nr:dihydrodipicolinate reductase [Candidatus Binatia bacterium]
MPRDVIVWGTGNVGVPALRIVLSNPALRLAGVIVSNPAKVGKDAGELCGLPPTGVRATNDVAAALASGADAVAYCASGDFRPTAALDDIERCLRAGLNVVSTSVYPLYDPISAPADLRERIDAACKAGRSSIFVSGIDPGFVNDIVPLLLSGLCERVDEIRAFELFNYSTYAQPEAVRNLVGMGQPMDATPPMLTPGVPTMVWGGPIRLMARGLGLELEEIRERVEKRALPRTVETQLGRFDEGTMGAFRLEIEGIVHGRPLLVIDHVTRIVNDIASEWPRPKGDGAHGVILTGRPKLTVTFDPEDEDGSAAGGGNTTAAARIVNSIPFVCAAPPGMLDALQVPLAIGRGLVR